MGMSPLKFVVTPRFRLAVGSSTRPTLSLWRVAWCSRSCYIDVVIRPLGGRTGAALSSLTGTNPKTGNGPQGGLFRQPSVAG